MNTQKKTQIKNLIKALRMAQSAYNGLADCACEDRQTGEVYHMMKEYFAIEAKVRRLSMQYDVPHADTF